jgi:hypothetical protein
MDAGVEEIDRVGKLVVDRAEHLHTKRLQSPLAFKQRRIVCHVECDVLHPSRRIRVLDCRTGGGNLEEGDVAAVIEAKEDVQVGAVHLDRGNHVVGHGVREGQAQRLGVELNGFLRIVATEGDMVESTQHGKCSSEGGGRARNRAA